MSYTPFLQSLNFCLGKACDSNYMSSGFKSWDKEGVRVYSSLSVIVLVFVGIKKTFDFELI